METEEESVSLGCGLGPAAQWKGSVSQGENPAGQSSIQLYLSRMEILEKAVTLVSSLLALLSSLALQGHRIIQLCGWENHFLRSQQEAAGSTAELCSQCVLRPSAVPSPPRHTQLGLPGSSMPSWPTALRKPGRL